MSSGFTCTAVRDGLSIKILSVCNRCGASRVVSIADGSLGEWERTHQCTPQRKPPQSTVLQMRRAKDPWSDRKTSGADGCIERSMASNNHESK